MAALRVGPMYDFGNLLDTVGEDAVGIHLLVSCKPQLRLSDAIKVLKGNTARWLFMGHPELKKSLWGGHLWNPSYFVVTVSERSTAQVEAYIQSQERRAPHGGDRNQS